MAAPARRRATYEDLLTAPAHHVAEIIDGELRVQPRPALAHTLAASALGSELHGPFQRGRGGPGGWVILDEPELHLGSEVLVPDLAGWRRERLPIVPEAPAIELAPDWTCEVLSPSTEATDRAQKIPIFARERVAYIWLVSPAAQTLEVFVLDGETYRLRRVLQGETHAAVEPFEAIQLELGALWAR